MFLNCHVSICIYYLQYLEAVLDKVVVLPTGSSSLRVILQQDKKLLGQLVDVLHHCWQRELQQPREGHQSLCDHLRGRRETAEVVAVGSRGSNLCFMCFIYQELGQIN